MTRFVLTILALTFIAGCTPGIRISPAELDSFSSPTVRDHIQKQEVAIGMSQTAVRYAWGAPIRVDVNPEDNTEVWVYTKYRVYVYKLTFTDGKLGAISSGVSVNRPMPEAQSGVAQSEATAESTQPQTAPSADTEIQIEE